MMELFVLACAALSVYAQVALMASKRAQKGKGKDKKRKPEPAWFIHLNKPEMGKMFLMKREFDSSQAAQRWTDLLAEVKLVYNCCDARSESQVETMMYATAVQAIFDDYAMGPTCIPRHFKDLYDLLRFRHPHLSIRHLDWGKADDDSESYDINPLLTEDEASYVADQLIEMRELRILKRNGLLVIPSLTPSYTT